VKYSDGEIKVNKQMVCPKCGNEFIVKNISKDGKVEDMCLKCGYTGPFDEGLGKKNIEWADKSWNPITGCRGPVICKENAVVNSQLTMIAEVGQDPREATYHQICPGCYAYSIARRLKGRYGYPEEDFFAPTWHPDKVDLPLKRKKPSVYFAVSMGDWLSDEVKHWWREEMLYVMAKAKQHLFLILTKREENIKLLKDLELPDNLWIGVSVCYAYQIKGARTLAEAELETETGRSPLKFISFEPLMEEKVSYTPLDGIDWIIAGGRTRQGEYPAFTPPEKWVTNLAVEAKDKGIPMFLKPNLPYHNDRQEMPQAYHQWRVKQ